MNPRTRHLFGQFLLLLVVVAAAALLYAPMLLGSILLVEAFPEHPLLCSSILLVVGVIGFLSVVGSTAESYRSIKFVSRGFLLLFSITAGLLSLEAFSFGVINAAKAEVLKDYLPLIGGLVLVLLGAVGVKYGLGLRARYWIVALAILVAVVLAVLVSQSLIVVS